MRHATYILASIAIILGAMVSTSSCVTNNGDIGPLYGVWALDSITVNGMVDNRWRADGAEVNFEFQNNIINIQTVYPLHDYVSRWGTWSREGDKLTLYYNHHDDLNAPGKGIYEAPAWLPDVTADGTAQYTVKISGKHMVLTGRIPDGGEPDVIYLRKTY